MTSRDLDNCPEFVSSVLQYRDLFRVLGGAVGAQAGI
jgi:hypothetical protein